MYSVLVAVFALVTIQMSFFFFFYIPSHIAYHIHYNVLLPTVCSGCNSLSPPLDGNIHFLTRIRILQLLLP